MGEGLRVVTILCVDRAEGFVILGNRAYMYIYIDIYIYVRYSNINCIS